MFAGKPGTAQVKHLLGAPLEGRRVALPQNKRLGRKGFLRSNTLSYYEHYTNLERRSSVLSLPLQLVFTVLVQAHFLISFHLPLTLMVEPLLRTNTLAYFAAASSTETKR